MTDDLWFPCYPSKFLGALSGLSPDDGYLYLIVCLRIYEIGGPCPDAPEVLARRSGMSVRRVKTTLDHLVKAGKLVLGTKGLMNEFAAGVLKNIEENATVSKKAAIARREKTVIKQRNGHASALRLHTPTKTTSSTELDLGSDSKRGVRAAVKIVRAPLSPDWELSEVALSAAIKAGMSEVDAVALAGRFKQHYLASGMRMADWHAKWMGWVFEEAERPRRGGGKKQSFMDVALGR